MTERVSEFGTSAALPLEEGDITHKTAGDMLREAREAHGLHIEMVAAALKVPPQKLIALEADDIASLPDPVFARALASSVCRALRIDPAPVLAKLPGAQRAALALADRTLKSNIVSGTPRWNGGRSSGLPSRALLTVVGLLLVGAAVLFWLPQSVFDQVGASVSRWTSRGDGDTAPVAEAPAAAPAPGGSSVVVESAPVSPVAPQPRLHPRRWARPPRQPRRRAARPLRRRLRLLLLLRHLPAASSWSSSRARNAGSPLPKPAASSCCAAACRPAKRWPCRERCRCRWWWGALRRSMCRCTESPTI